MADNLQLNAGADGGILASATLTFSGDEAGVQVCGCGILSGSEGSWTFSQFVGGTGTVAAGVQRVTIADDDTNLAAMVVDLDAIAASLAGTLTVGSHAVTNAGTFVVQVDGAALTALQLIDDAVYADDAPFTLTTSKVMAGGAIRDDSLSALAAAENDVVPLRVGSTGALHVTGAGGGTQYQVDDVAGATGTGTLALAIRDDSLTTLTPVDGDYVGLRVSSTGALHVTGGGGGTEYTEDVATANPIVGTATLMERDDALTTLTPVEGDWVGLRGTSKGALWVGVDDTVAATQSGTWNVATVTTVTTVATVTNLAQLGGQAIAMGTGARTAGTQRVTIATDDVVPVTNAALAVVGEGTITGATLRVTQATDDDGVAHLAAIAGYLDTEVAAIVTAVQLLDNAISGAGFNITQLGGANVPIGAGTEAAAIRITLANDSTGTLTVDTTGTSGLEVVQVTAGDLNMTEASASAIKTAVEKIDNPVAVLGTDTYSETTTSGNVVGAVRNDDLATLADTDNEIAPLQVNSEGALYTTACASETKRASGVAAGGAPGTDDIVAAVGSRKIRVLALGLFATSATPNNVFLDNADNDLLFNTANPLPLAIDADADNVAGFVLPFNPGGWFETDTVNEAVTLNSSAAQDIAWTITYIEVP